MKHDGFYPHVSSNLDRFLSIVSAGCNSGTIWQEQGFCLVFIRKAWLFNTHLFVRKWKHLHISLSSPKTSLTKATRFSKFEFDLISSFPTSSFCSQHLLICLRPSSTHLLHMLCFPKGLKVGDDITWHFYYPKLKWEWVWCQHSLVVLTFDFEQSIRLSALNSHGCVPQGCSDKAGRAVSVCRGSFCYSGL